MKRHFLSLVALYSIVAMFLNACRVTKVAITQTSTPHQAPYQAARTKHHDLLHTKLEVNFDWQRQHLYGVATLKIQPHCFPPRYLALYAQGFRVHSVARLEECVRNPLGYTYDGKKLIIDLGEIRQVGEAYWVEVAYTAQSNKLPSEEAVRLDSSKGLFFVNPDGSDPTKPQQIWTQGKPKANSSWFPTNDAPNQRCTQEIYITVDERFSTLSNGLLGYSKLNGDHTRTDYWYMDLPYPPYLFMLAVGEFSIVQDTWEDIEVSYYVEPAYEQYAKYFCYRLK